MLRFPKRPGWGSSRKRRNAAQLCGFDQTSHSDHVGPAAHPGDLQAAEDTSLQGALTHLQPPGIRPAEAGSPAGRF